MDLTCKDRVYRAIFRKDLDYFPSQIDFTPAAACSLLLSLGCLEDELNDLLDNHIVDCFSLGSVEEYLQNPLILKSAIDSGLAYQDVDNHIVYDIWGVGWDIIPDGGWPKIHPLENLDNYHSYNFPDPYNPHMMDFVRDTILHRNDKYFILGSHHTALFERAWALRGFENSLMDLYANRNFAEELYDKITEFQIEIAKQFISEGIDGVRVGDDYGMQNGLLMKPDLWREIIKPRLGRIWEVYQKANIPVIHHTCGDVRSIMDDFIEMGLDVLHPVQPLAMPITSIMEKYGNVLSFFGGIDTQRLLPFGTPDKVDESTKFCIDTLGAQGGYIVSPAQAIMEDVPLENIFSLVGAIKKYRYIG